MDRPVHRLPCGVLMNSRLERERKANNLIFATGNRLSLIRFHDLNEGSSVNMIRRLKTIPAGTHALDLGCGQGKNAVELAKRGVKVTAIDMSDVALQQAAERKREAGLTDYPRFVQMNAEEVEFKPQSFDLVYGAGIIHHLELRSVMPRIARMLKPDGWAMFDETMDYHPIVNLVRTLTPSARTPDEHPLRVEDFALMRQYFSDVRVTHHHLIAPVTSVLPGQLGRKIEWVAHRVDDVLLSLPGMEKYGWKALLELHGPVHTARD